MAEAHPDEIYRARYYAEIQRTRLQLERFTESGMRMFEGPSADRLEDITDGYVADLRLHLEELERFLDMVKRAS